MMNSIRRARTEARTRIRSRRNKQHGLTLVELMVTILLAAILTAGLFYMASGQQETYQVQMSQLSTQENLWGTMVYLSREITRAGMGFGRCPGGKVKMWDGNTPAGVAEAPLVALAVHNACNSLTTDISDLTNCPADTDEPDSFTVTYSNAPAVGNLPGAQLQTGAIASNATLQIRSAGNFGATHADGGKEWLILWDGHFKQCTLLNLDPSFDPATCGEPCTLPHPAAGSYSVPDDINPPDTENIFPGIGYRPGALVIRVTEDTTPRHFAIQESADHPPRLVTWQTWDANPSADTGNMEVVAEGVEDMQIAWACDINNNSIYEEGTTEADRCCDEWAFNTPATYDCSGHATTSCHNDDPTEVSSLCRGPEIVRITLISRTASPDPTNQKSNRPAAEDRAAGTADDDLTETKKLGTFLRSVLTTLVKLHNMSS